MRYARTGLAVLTLLLVQPIAAADTIFFLEEPAEGSTVTGIVEVGGWVLDERGVSNIELYVDNLLISEADLNQPRYDVIQAYPWYAGTASARPGFGTSFNSAMFTDGAHSLFVRVTFPDGTVEDFAHRTVVVDNDLNQAPIGAIELPGEQQPMNGVFPVTGWVLDDGEVARVEVMVDGLVMGETVLGIPRPDIENRYPDIAGAEGAGWIYNLDSTRLVNGVHVLSARLWDTEGASRVVGTRFVQVLNVGANLAPFGRIDWPLPNHVMYGIGCRTGGGYSGEPPEIDEWELVSGWALDVGQRGDVGGVKWVELLINGTIIRNTLVDDEWFPAYDQYVNYYGLERLDIHRLFPDIPVSKDSGFAFLLNIGELIGEGYHQGLHYLTIRAGDIEGNTADIARIPVIFDCNDDADRPSFGDIFEPEFMEVVSGTTELTGWAIDFNGLIEVQVWIDGIYAGNATYGLASPDVEANYPWYPLAHRRNARWAFDLDTTQFNDGEHQLVIRTVDFFGGTNFLGQRPFVIDNPNLGDARPVDAESASSAKRSIELRR